VEVPEAEFLLLQAAEMFRMERKTKRMAYDEKYDFFITTPLTENL